MAYRQNDQPIVAPSRQEGDETVQKFHTPTVGVREKLIAIFLVVKVLPLVLLAYIAWQALMSLGTILQETAVVKSHRALTTLGSTLHETAVKDSRNALTALARERIEHISTDTAQKVAEFLYQRDTDITVLARFCKNFSFDSPESGRDSIEEFFSKYDDSKTSMIRRHGEWKVADDGLSWAQVDPYFPPPETQKRSVNTENEETVDGATFRYRPPYGFADDVNRFKHVPLYDEIALLDKNGIQIAKYVTPHSTKKRFPFPKELQDVSDPNNTFVKAEHYVAEFPKLGRDGIYVSDVIGAYVPSHFVGMYTPSYMASKRIDAKIAELATDESGKNAEIVWKLRVLNAELKNEEEKFNSRAAINKTVRDEIDNRLGTDETWHIEVKSLQQVSDELKTLGFSELAKEILDIPFEPEGEAYAGAENPRGIRFEGIIRWAKPVIDGDGEVRGYVTFALNHDHLLEMIDHITPMESRYTELSDAFNGNYAFIWDYQCRSIVHPRHYSIVGYNPETGRPETPWLEQTLYNGMIESGFDRADWQDYIATLENYIPWTGDKDSIAFQSRAKRPAAELTKLGLMGLDGRYLNNAPQCTGWMDLAKDGGSGSLFILWSGLYKLNTAAAIPYYTGQYSPEVRGNRCGFGFIAIGSGIDDFSRPANEMGSFLTELVNENVQSTTSEMGNILEEMVSRNVQHTTRDLIITTIVLSVIVVFIAIWMASYLSKKLQWLIAGITTFRQGHRDFRFDVKVKDEFGQLAHSFDEMAENIVHSVHTPLVITDMDLNFIYANDDALNLIDAKLEDIVGRPYKEKSIYHYGTKYCPILALHEDRESEVLFLKHAGKSFYLQGVANYLRSEHGKKQGYIITCKDVTEISFKQVELERAKEEAELANQHKSRFLARMSHELRTPMNAIIGINEITQSKIGNISNVTDQQELHDNLAHLKSSSQHLLGLLNDILEASNLESGMVTLVEKPLQLQVMLDGISEGIQSKCDNKELKWTTNFDLATSYFLTDGLRLHQALGHLLDNAVKYTPQHGEVSLTVREKDRKEDKVLLSFTVKDTGIGIPKDKMSMIFLPFEQAEEASAKYTSGSGLGLGIVRRILELFNTEIAIQSEIGKGSEFSFDIWLQEDKTGGKAVAVTENIANRYAGQRALVIDDVRLNRIVLVHLLQEAGFVTDEAKDGKEGAEMFEQSPENTYNIIFMDIQMPVMDGWESAAVIRSLRRKDALTVPIVTVSANAFHEDIEKSLASGMNAHYAKPIERGTLTEILAEFCKSS